MDPALSAALAPLTASPRLAGLQAKLEAAGAELLKEGTLELLTDLIGVEGAPFTEEEHLLITDFEEEPCRGADPEKDTGRRDPRGRCA